MNGYGDIKKVCIYGTGGVGGYFGGRIAEVFNKSPEFKRSEIFFIARGKHLKVIQQNGIKLKTPERTISAKPKFATSGISEIPSPDLILLCVKSYDLSRAVASIKTVMKENTVIIPLLNGVDIYERIRVVLNVGIVLLACLYLSTYIESPGVINQIGGNGVIIFGKDKKYPQYNGENVKSFFDKAGIKYDWRDDSYPPIWEKYLFIAAFGLVTAFTGKSLGEVMENGKYRQMVNGIIEEIYAISRAKSINLHADIVEKTLQMGYNFPCETRTSYQRDIESKARFNEGDLFGGFIIREGKALGIPTPVTESVYQAAVD